LNPDGIAIVEVDDGAQRLAIVEAFSTDAFPVRLVMPA
jgi:hypothetical protein